MYSNFLKPILFKFDPEHVHNFFTFSGETLGKNSITRNLVGAIYNYKSNSNEKIIDGIKYRTPFLLSAGFDYNGRLSQILPFIGLGGEEIGSVTAEECAGNPKPRLRRLPKNKSIIVNKGLKNEGVDKIIKRLKKRKKYLNFVTGISVALTNTSQNIDLSNAINDYMYSLKRLTEESIGDYYTLNISCPNAFCGEHFTKPEWLEQLLKSITTLNIRKPLYLKLPINKSSEELEILVQIALKYSLNGIVIGNLNKNYDELEFRSEAPTEYKGGLSGKPTRERSTKLIKYFREKFGPDLTIIASGGIMSENDLNEKIEAGADLFQLITGLIYEGPALINRLNKHYEKLKDVNT